MTVRIAIIGAGLAGLTLACRLRSKAQVKVFEKSNVVGGRLSTFRSGGFEFDHGAQYFTIRSEAFRKFLEPALQHGIVVPWDPHIVTLEIGREAIVEPREETIYVASPGMEALCAHLAEEISVTIDTEIVSCKRKKNAWQPVKANGDFLEEFDWIVSAAPPHHSLSWAPEFFADGVAFDHVRLRGCYSLMLGFEDAVPVSWQGAFVRNSPIGWMAVNSHKYGREGGPSLLVQCSGEWTEEHLECASENIEVMLSNELKNLTGIDITSAKHCELFRWQYASIAVPLGLDCLFDPEAQLAACGDWCIKGRVEGAFKSADALAARLFAVLPQ